MIPPYADDAYARGLPRLLFYVAAASVMFATHMPYVSRDKRRADMSATAAHIIPMQRDDCCRSHFPHGRRLFHEAALRSHALSRRLFSDVATTPERFIARFFRCEHDMPPIAITPRAALCVVSRRAAQVRYAR